MRIVRHCLSALMLFAAAFAVSANFETAQAASKKGKHAKPASATAQTHAPNNTQNAVPGPPDPGVYK